MPKRSYRSDDEARASKRRRVDSLQVEEEYWLDGPIRQLYQELKDLLPEFENVEKSRKLGIHKAAYKYMCHLEGLVNPVVRPYLKDFFAPVRWLRLMKGLHNIDDVKKRREFEGLLKVTDYIIFLHKATRSVVRNNVNWEQILEYIQYEPTFKRNRQFL